MPVVGYKKSSRINCKNKTNFGLFTAGIGGAKTDRAFNFTAIKTSLFSAGVLKLTLDLNLVRAHGT